MTSNTMMELEGLVATESELAANRDDTNHDNTSVYKTAYASLYHVSWISDGNVGPAGDSESYECVGSFKCCLCWNDERVCGHKKTAESDDDVSE